MKKSYIAHLEEIESEKTNGIKIKSSQPLSELWKIIIDKLFLGVALAAILLPLQRCQYLNNIKSESVLEVQQMNLGMLSKAQENLAESITEISLILHQYVDADADHRAMLYRELKLKNAKAQISINVIDAVTGDKTRLGKNLSNQLNSIDRELRNSNFTDAKREILITNLQKLFFDLLKEVKNHVSPPKI